MTRISWKRIDVIRAMSEDVRMICDASTVEERISRDAPTRKQLSLLKSICMDQRIHPSLRDIAEEARSGISRSQASKIIGSLMVFVRVALGTCENIEESMDTQRRSANAFGARAPRKGR